MSPLPPWLRKNQLMLWTLCALRDLGGRAHLDPLYKRLGQLLRIPEDLLWMEHPPGAKQEDYVVRHRMRWVLTELGFMGLVHSHGQGNWSLSDQGTAFLGPMDEENAPMEGRQWIRETGIQMTRVERTLEARLIADRRAGRSPRRGNGGASAPSQSPPLGPDGWPEEPIRSRGAPVSRERMRQIEARAMSRLRRRSEDSPRTLVARFEGGICVICDQPINIGDAIAIAYQDAPPDVEGWRHDRCSRGGAGDRARVSPPGKPPRRSDIRRRQFPVEGHD